MIDYIIYLLVLIGSIVGSFISMAAIEYYKNSRRSTGLNIEMIGNKAKVTDDDNRLITGVKGIKLKSKGESSCVISIDVEFNY